ncbi:MAG TPA: SLBB domain-containing protein [Longimicrobiales bacterium]|nr:SLBB domain-containing protein [Longimicrobiales bacterium]
MKLRLHPAGLLGGRVILVLFTGMLVAAAAPAETAAQNPPPTAPPRDTTAARRALQERLGRDVTQSEILERLRNSGMTRSQIRARLQQLGYDPSLADRYFDALERGGSLPAEQPSDTFIEALTRLGLAGTAGRETSDSALFALEPDSLLIDEDSTAVGRQVFGLLTFRRAGSQFAPPTFGPVDPGYRLGPGDELLLVLTGDVEEAYPISVSREGLIFIPAVGQMSVNGLTLAQLEDALYARLGSVYSGISRSPNATTRFQVSLGALRANQIIVTGDVARPGSYQVSSVAGLFAALYQAGGPTAEGSFRHIEVHRGGRLVHVADLYDFLIRGDGSSDIRLENNDRVFVPPAGAQAQVEGSVRRPAIYEVRPGESLQDLLAFAGGFRSDALVRNVQIDRIVPPSDQRPGFYRTLVSVDAAQLAGAPTEPVRDGDIVTVSAVPDVRRNRVWVSGEVRNPGVYEWTSGSTLWSMLERADGPGDFAYLARAHIYRLTTTDGSRSLIRASLERDAAGGPVDDVVLADNDSIVVLSRNELRTSEFVTIDGFVKKPATYPLARGMTLHDLILAADGFSHGAYVLEAEISRMPDPLLRTDITAHVFRIPLGTPSASSGGGLVPDWIPGEAEVELTHGDRVFIRRAPGYESVREVHVTGQVLVPGRYVLESREERVADVLARAGGLTPQAFPAGIHVIREGQVVAADLQRALREPDDPNNILLTAGDSLHVPEYEGTVLVRGAVNFEALVVFAPGRGLDYYISQAGGYSDEADKHRVTVSYKSGERAVVTPRWVGTSEPPVQPGAEIFVPVKPEDSRGPNWDQVFTRGAAILSAVATAMFAISQLR